MQRERCSFSSFSPQTNFCPPLVPISARSRSAFQAPEYRESEHDHPGREQAQPISGWRRSCDACETSIHGRVTWAELADAFSSRDGRGVQLCQLVVVTDAVAVGVVRSGRAIGDSGGRRLRAGRGRGSEVIGNGGLDLGVDVAAVAQNQVRERRILLDVRAKDVEVAGPTGGGAMAGRASGYAEADALALELVVERFLQSCGKRGRGVRARSRAERGQANEHGDDERGASDASGAFGHHLWAHRKTCSWPRTVKSSSCRLYASARSSQCGRKNQSTVPQTPNLGLPLPLVFSPPTSLS